MAEKVTRTIVSADGRPVATVSGDDTPANAAALARLESLDAREREALDDLLDELRDFEGDE